MLRDWRVSINVFMNQALTSRLTDLLAGLSIAGLLLPEAVAYSGLANLPPQAGVIALFAGMLCYGLIGRSRYAVVTATSSSAAVLAAATLSMAGADPAARIALASILVVATGVAFLLAGGLHLGAMSNLIARPVLRGFAFGLALVIAVKQWPHLVGLHAQGTAFVALFPEILRRYPEWHLPSFICGALALIALFASERLKRLPAALVVIVVSIAASSWLSAHGVELTGPIQLNLALPAFSVPPGEQWLPLGELALALMFILYAESYGSIRTFALKRNDTVQPNRDLVALGVANVVSGLLQGAPVGAGYSGTSANEAAGAQSRAAGLVAVGVVLVLVLLCLPWIERIPRPVLAAIVIHAVSHSLKPSVFRSYFLWRRDRIVALAAVLAVIVLGVLNGLLAAIAVSLAMLLRELASPRLAVLGRVGEHDYVSLTRYPQAISVPDVLVLRPEEPLFFANAEPLLAQAREQVREHAQTELVVLSLEESPDLDSTSLEALNEFCEWLAARAIHIRVARLKDRARDALACTMIAQLSAASALDYSSVDDAVRGECVALPRQAT
jgi:MFS superfamily sulfate permease-like transporter